MMPPKKLSIVKHRLQTMDRAIESSSESAIDLTRDEDDTDSTSTSDLGDPKQKAFTHHTARNTMSFEPQRIRNTSSTSNDLTPLKRKHDIERGPNSCHDGSSYGVEKKVKRTNIPKLQSEDFVDMTEDDFENLDGNGDFQHVECHNKSCRIPKSSSITSVEQVVDNIERIDLTGSTTSRLSMSNPSTPNSDDDLDDESDADSELDEVKSDDDVQYMGQNKIKKRNTIRPVLAFTRRNTKSREYKRVIFKGEKVERGTCIEFLDGTFMRVHTIYSDPKEEYIFIGLMFTRIAEKEMLMPKQRDSLLGWRLTDKQTAKLPRDFGSQQLLNEVYQRVRFHVGEPACDEGLWRRSAQEFKRVRVLCITNQSYKQYRLLPERSEVSNHSTDHSEFMRKVVQEYPLICRWKEVIVHDEYGGHQEHRFEKPSRRDLDVSFDKSDDQLQQAWRGKTVNLALPLARPPQMVDGFCGAGGMSSAARQAGIEVVRSFDFDENKIATHASNFPQCKSMHMEIHDFIRLPEEQHSRIDILHLSPPCQPFSPANTTPNQEKNERNQAPLLGCGDVINCLRPRVVTVEESPGIRVRHVEWFDKLINQFLVLGFSVRWATLSCRDFGVPQLRKRLFLIAAAPGEDLPEFPKPTHRPGEVSIRQTLDELEQAHRDEPLDHHDAKTGTGRAPYDANCLAKTITCKGGENYHPNGKRQFTIREFLALQTFPNNFKFPMARNGRPFPLAEMKTQLGNAVPPLFGKAILESIVRSLKARDKRRV